MEDNDKRKARLADSDAVEVVASQPCEEAKIIATKGKVTIKTQDGSVQLTPDTAELLMSYLPSMVEHARHILLDFDNEKALDCEHSNAYYEDRGMTFSHESGSAEDRSMWVCPDCGLEFMGDPRPRTEVDISSATPF